MQRFTLAALLALGVLAAAPASAQSGTVLGGRPPGCPHAFCGCGAALAAFGHHVRSLWAARAWLRFPRAAPAPGMAAVRAHHVMLLEAPGHAPGYWIVHDSNGGRHLTWRHERDLRGYVIVDPHGGRRAW